MTRATRVLSVAAIVAAMGFVGVRAQQAPGGRAGGAPSPLATALWTAFDGNKDGSVTKDEMQAAFDAWYASANGSGGASITTDQLATSLNAVVPAPAPPTGAAPGGGGGRPGGAGAPGGPGGGRGGARGPFVAGATTPGLNDKCGGRSQMPT